MLSGLAGARHITWTDAGDRSGRALVTVELHADAADPALEALSGLGVPAEDVAPAPGRDPARARSRERANLPGRTFSAGRRVRATGCSLPCVHGRCRGYAAYGVIYNNGLIGRDGRRPRPAPDRGELRGNRQARPAGLARFLDPCRRARRHRLGRRRAHRAARPPGPARRASVERAGVLEGLTTVNSSTFLVALAAGIAGMLALESPRELRRGCCDLGDHGPGVVLPRRGGRRRRDREGGGGPGGTGHQHRNARDGRHPCADGAEALRAAPRARHEPYPPLTPLTKLDDLVDELEARRRRVVVVPSGR